MSDAERAAYVQDVNGARNENMTKLQEAFAVARATIAPLMVQEFRYHRARGCSGYPSIRETNETLERFLEQFKEDVENDYREAVGDEAYARL